MGVAVLLFLVGVGLVRLDRMSCAYGLYIVVDVLFLLQLLK